MSLDSQIFMYSVDTGHFYSRREAYLHRMNCRYRSEKNYLSSRIAFFDDVMQEYGYTSKDLNDIKNGRFAEMAHYIPGTSGLLHEYFYWHSRIRHKRKKAAESKAALLRLLKNKAEQNEKTGGRDHTRSVREEELRDTNIISVFESSLTRMLGIQEEELSDALLVVQIYYFDVFKDISFHGFLFRGEKYRYYTSSAGQIRKKKAVFIKEALWEQFEKTIMCGLTLERINAKGGNNVNKHLAYMALTNSATDLWEDFDIQRSIVVEDFETSVGGTVDFIDETDYSVTRQYMDIPIPHTDGAGMVLPSLLPRNAMFRAPWIKGLLGVFDFRRYLRETDCPPIVRDIYGQEHDILAEDIQIIFTKSQFKMYKYYQSWDEYKAYYEKYHCTAGLCNVKEPRIKNARINYQMLQTLTDVSESEILELASPSIRRITGICSSEECMMEALGITPYNMHPTPFQEAVKLYPALLNDTYTKDMLRDIKNSLLKKYRSGKLEILGKYTFVLPDFYAACEYWFGGRERPMGLLKEGEVYCRLFPRHEKLDCLRSPHLYKEHAVRRNMACPASHAGQELRREEMETWFLTDAVYTSTQDLISKILMFDCDGDKLLLVAEPQFVSIAQRNMKDIVPLYYHMKKAKPQQLSAQTIYQGLNTAFIHSNIGVYSNHISKIWNSDVFLSGTEEERREAVNCVKLLCCENNFVIDSAKTLYMPKRPDWFAPVVSQFTRQKLPAFFCFAKDKTPEQIAPRNRSFVNRLYDLIPNPPLRAASLKLAPLDYRKLMADPNIRCPREVSDLYQKLNPVYRYKINMKEEYADNLHYVACEIRGQFLRLGYSEETLADMLVSYTYGNEKRCKELLWFCFGRVIAANLKHNIETPKTKYIRCSDCGEWVEVPSSSRSPRCPRCREAATLTKYSRYNSKRKQLPPVRAR